MRESSYPLQVICLISEIENLGTLCVNIMDTSKEAEALSLFQTMSLRKNSLQYMDLARMRTKRRASSVTSSGAAIDALEKKWMIFSSGCELKKLKILVDKEPKLLLKRDFVTGYTAVHWAAKQGNMDVLTWLLKQGADVNSKSNGGYTPLHLAVMHGRENAMNVLINDYDADINARDHSGRKPRHYLKNDMPQWAQRILKATPSVDLGNPKFTNSLSRRKKGGRMSLTNALSSVLVMKVDPAIHVASDPLLMHKQPSEELEVFASGNLSGDESKSRHENRDKRKKRSLSLAASFKHKRRQERKSSESGRMSVPSSPAPDMKSTPKLRSTSALLTIEHPHFQNEPNGSEHYNENSTSLTDIDSPYPERRPQAQNDWKVITMV